jgi:ABC-type Fe3+ transport system substrate-binding protein
VIPQFEEEFGITVVSQGGTGSENANRMMAERKAGIFSVDAWVTGTTTPQSLLIPNNLLVPLEPLLIHPDVLDVSNWFDNRLWWSDKSLIYTLGYAANGGKRSAIAWNTDELSTEEAQTVKSWQDFLDPKWTGKLAAVEPWSTGQGNNAAWMYQNMGPDFWSRMISEVDLEIYTDQRTASEAVALGKQVACLMGCGRQVSDLTKEGLPIERYWPTALSEGLTISTGGSNIMSVDNPPHPAAMQLFINWLLLQPAQHTLEESTGNNSIRIDTTKEGVMDVNRLYEDVTYANPCCDPKYTAEFDEAWANLQTIREDFLAGKLN